MSLYELLLLLHVVAAVIWLGAGFLLNVIAFRAERADDVEGLRRMMQDSAALSQTLFIPSSMAVFVLGVLLVLDGPWSFGDLWIVLALVGYAATFLTGILVMKPGSERIAAMMERDGGLSAHGVVEVRKFLLKSRVDVVLLYLVVVVMVVKPTGDDVGVLLALAVVLAAAVAFVVLRLRALDATSPAPAGTALT